MPYQIKNWNDHFENARSRERKQCAWCPLPNKQDGLGYGLIMLEDNGAAIYGAFVAVVLMCSKQSCPRGGYLTDTGRVDGRPLTAKELSVKTKIKPSIIEEMLELTTSKSVDWVANTGANEQATRQLPANYPPTTLEEKGREGNRREGKGEKRGSARVVPENVQSILDCRPEFARLDPDAIAKILHDFQADPSFEQKLQEFICDAANSIDPPRSPTSMLRAYLSRANLRPTEEKTSRFN